MKIHRKLKRACRDIVLEYYFDPVSGFQFAAAPIGCNPTVTMTKYISIKVIDGVKITKWHRLARLKAREEIRKEMEATLKEGIKMITEIVP